MKSCLIKATDYLEKNYDILNRLNVFPVPDGDTGTNMLSTFEAGTRVLLLQREEEDSIASIAAFFTPELTKNSRGNSGFIIARFFHGFFESIDGKTRLETHDLAAAFSTGLYQVQSSLFSPVEGTMITIIRAMTEELWALSGAKKGPVESIVSAVAAGRKALDETPKLLPILAKAGVIDSGGLGFIFLLEGFLRALTRSEPKREREKDYRFDPREAGTAGAAASEGAAAGGAANDTTEEQFYGYCTEVSVLHVENPDRQKISSFLEERGNSIALVCEEHFLKLHIHTDTPAQIIEFMKSIGTVEHVKIDNLTEQVSRFSAVEDPDGECAVLACIPGEGFREIFDSLEVRHCIPYSSHLPSAGEILEEIEALREKNIILLPNNKNILPAAMTAAEKTEKHVAVIHSKSVVEGLTAAYGFSANDKIEDNVANMQDCIDMAVGIFVYESSAPSHFDGRDIRAGEFFALCEGELLACGPELTGVVLNSLTERGLEECSNLSFFYRDEEVKGRLSAFKELLAEKTEHIEHEFLFGGQSRESLIISME